MAKQELLRLPTDRRGGHQAVKGMQSAIEHREGDRHPGLLQGVDIGPRLIGKRVDAADQADGRRGKPAASPARAGTA